ncbi:uncharacterized protein YbjT (DUF2867 family) [Rhodococcus sp. 27YEA15]|uniref:NAD-dependent epimerase/dehydratase family protein n=1 Tax=Rhodococcus sp. 27YEA15 TaxID=3156259 RepID=UPI003C7A43B5
MRVAIFGASGMIGQGVLRACLADPTVEQIVVIGRTSPGLHENKIREVVHNDFTDLTAIADVLDGLDGCFYCLGVSSAGHTEAEYTRITYDYTLAVARAVYENSPDATFMYVSGAGTDSSETGRAMWARVKGRTENNLLAMPFTAYMFRPGYIQPGDGIVSKTPLYRWMYRVGSWLYPVLRRIAPGYVTTTAELGRAMIALASSDGKGPFILDSHEINRLGLDSADRR